MILKYRIFKKLQVNRENDDRSTCENPKCVFTKGEAFVQFKALSMFERIERKEVKEIVSQVIDIFLMSLVSQLGSCNL